MATLGVALTAPETGWKRYDDSDSRIVYTGTTTIITDSEYAYNNCTATYFLSSNSGCSISFKFYGTKLRIIDSIYWNRSATVNISIDGVVETYDDYSSTANILQALLYEKTGLSLGIHTVTITNGTTAVFGLDAIDIDEDGELKLYYTPTNLTATAGDSKVTLSWTAATSATSYIIKRATTSGGTYTTIASGVADTSYVDTDVVNGTTYYYVVIAVNDYGESENSNEASATPQATGKALLLIELVDGLQKEYQLTETEVNAFIAWYNTRAGGTGDPCYIFTKDFNLGPFDSRKDYLVFDKIQNFEVMAYSA